MLQTGLKESDRRSFFQEAYDCATLHLGMGGEKWQPVAQGTAIF